MLEIRDLTVRYGPFTALHGLNLSVQQGEIVKEDQPMVEVMIAAWMRPGTLETMRGVICPPMLWPIKWMLRSPT